MRRKWLILILALLLPVGALAAVGSGIDLPAWLSKRMGDIRASVAPEQRDAAPVQRDVASERAAKPETPTTTARETAAGGAKSQKAPPKKTAALSRPAAPNVTSSGASGQNRPSIDIARLDPEGSSVIAGLAAPGADVTVLADGKPIAVVKADANGEWVVITPHKFASADPSLEARFGAMQLPRDVIASLPNADKGTPGGAKAQRTAAAVTRTMMSQLERLADNATTEAAAAGARRGANALASGGDAVTTTVVPPATTTATDTVPSTTRVASRALSTATDDSPVTTGNTGLPVPVQFVYREAVFTPEGEKAAALLLRFFKLKDYKKVILSGHADERGSQSANMQLSKARLDQIAKYLREGGFEGELELLPKGETEKYTGVDRSKYPVEELWQLDRRVEVKSFN